MHGTSREIERFSIENVSTSIFEPRNVSADHYRRAFLLAKAHAAILMHWRLVSPKLTRIACMTCNCW